MSCPHDAEVEMRVIIRAQSDDSYMVLQKKIKGQGLRLQYENQKKGFMIAEIPQANQGILFELLEQNATIERDISRDLD